MIDAEAIGGFLTSRKQLSRFGDSHGFHSATVAIGLLI